ncbi:MAG: hypothetical protein JXR10_14665 [Cyclobacteriaceae bacterium]
MRPQDIVILLKIVIKGDQPWTMKALSHELEISASEVSESLNRSSIAGLLFQNKKQVMRQGLMDFLQYGLCYVYPQQPGALVRGIPTAHAAPPLSQEIMSDTPYVWPHHEGNLRGQAIEPLYPSVPAACLKDLAFYEVMALCDALRVGRARERNIAVEVLKKRIC